MTRHVSPEGRAALEGEEGYVGHWYDIHDGVITGAYGHVRRPGDPDTFDKPQGDTWLSNDLRVVESCLNSHLPDGVSQNAYDACASLAFNIGCGGFLQSTVLRLMRAGDMAGAADAFRLWCKATINGVRVVDAVLVGRRERERTRFLMPDAPQ